MSSKQQSSPSKSRPCAFNTMNYKNETLDNDNTIDTFMGDSKIPKILNQKQIYNKQKQLILSQRRRQRLLSDGQFLPDGHLMQESTQNEDEMVMVELKNEDKLMNRMAKSVVKLNNFYQSNNLNSHLQQANSSTAEPQSN